MPMLVIRKGILRSLIHAANFVKVLLAFFESSAEETRSCCSALIACPDVTRLIVTSPCHEPAFFSLPAYSDLLSKHARTGAGVQKGCTPVCTPFAHCIV